METLVSVYEHCVWLVLPKEKTKVVLKNLESLGTCPDELIEVTDSSTLGMAMFGGELLKISSQRVSGTIDRLLEAEFKNATEITKKTVADIERKVNTAVAEMPAAKELTSFRDVTVMYRGKGFQSSVDSTESEVHLKAVALWKSIAVAKGVLKHLWVEILLQLSDNQKYKNHATPHRDLCKNAAYAKEEAHRMANEYAKVDSAVIKAIIESQKHELFEYDLDFDVELLIPKEVARADSGASLFEAILAMFPLHDVAKTPEEVLVALDRCRTGDSYKLASPSAQSRADKLHAVLSRLLDSREPDLFLAKDDSVLVPFVTQLQYFARWQMPAGAKDDAPEELVGAAAVTHAVEEAIKKNADGILTPKDLEMPLIYRWLLPEADKAKLDTLATVSHEATMAKKRAAGAETKKGKKKARKDDKATESALDLFKKYN